MIFTRGGERFKVANDGTLLRWHEWPTNPYLPAGVWLRLRWL